MIKVVLSASLLGAALISMPASGAEPAEGELVATDVAQAGADYAVQGEYVGEVELKQGKTKAAVQVIARGHGKFHAVWYLGGLPGDGWDGKTRIEADGSTANGVTTFQGEKGSGSLVDGVLTPRDANGKVLGELQRVERVSPTLGKEPPEGAVVLFDGTSPDAFEGARVTDDGLLMQGVTSKQKFGDCTLHLEFRTPFMPAAAGQARGNSGCYLQGRYEVQILDSYGLEGKDNECGGIYSVRNPSVNMCLPPLAWQTYDIEYVAARYDAASTKTANAKITVRHNGVLIHENVELPHGTTAAPVAEGPEDGPLFLQDHGNPVRFRNIWLLPAAE